MPAVAIFIMSADHQPISAGIAIHGEPAGAVQSAMSLLKRLAKRLPNKEGAQAVIYPVNSHASLLRASALASAESRKGRATPLPLALVVAQLGVQQAAEFFASQLAKPVKAERLDAPAALRVVEGGAA